MSTSFPTLVSQIYANNIANLSHTFSDKFNEYIESISRMKINPIYSSDKASYNKYKYKYIHFDLLLDSVSVQNKKFYVDFIIQLANNISLSKLSSYNYCNHFIFIKKTLGLNFTITMKLGNNYSANELEQSGKKRMKFAENALKFIFDDVYDKNYIESLDGFIENKCIIQIISDFIVPKVLFTLNSKEILKLFFNIYVSYKFGNAQIDEYYDWMFD